MDSITEFAKLFKERNNSPYQGPQTGVVVSPPPNIKVSLGDKIMLTKEHLILAAHVLNEYQRKLEIEGTTNIKSQVTLKDSLKEGVEVILIPSTDNQMYFLIDKAVRL